MLFLQIQVQLMKKYPFTSENPGPVDGKISGLEIATRWPIVQLVLAGSNKPLSCLLTNCCSYSLSFGLQERHFACLTHRLGIVPKFVHLVSYSSYQANRQKLADFGIDAFIHPSKARKDESHITSNCGKDQQN